jgi:hypothetical protein
MGKGLSWLPRLRWRQVIGQVARALGARFIWTEEADR